jgi:uncharacterized LabA/DUF88 family protein
MQLPYANGKLMNSEQSVAVYWDFENIHASLLENAKGSGTYRQCRYSAQEQLVDVEALMEFAASLGAVAINRAYGNWQWFSKYREVLLHNAVELIQLFPPGASAKNGADIKLCLDATEDIIRFPHISTILIVGGDSDFLPVAQKIKAAGKMLVGVGCESTTNRHWAHSCHEFRYYETLILEEAPIQNQLPENQVTVNAVPDAVDLIRRAIARLAANKGDPWVLKATIRPMVKRLDSTFDERTYGVSTFSDLLKQYSAIFELRKGQHDQEFRIKEYPPHTHKSDISMLSKLDMPT